MGKEITIGVRELRANLSGVLRQTRQGASFVVMSRNEVVAELRPPSEPVRTSRKLGLLKGRIRIAPDFDQWPDELLDAMEQE
jgi:antitoxin (DNA-binding transcriptional repressor) of toxin-antitoxin stability system